jgi:hypothetical protein
MQSELETLASKIDRFGVDFHRDSQLLALTPCFRISTLRACRLG